MAVFEEVRTVTPDGRVIVPWIIQRALGLDHGGPVRFRVEDGVVSLLAVDARKPEGGTARGRRDVRRELSAELNALLSATAGRQTVP